MKIYTQNIFKYSKLKEVGITKNPVGILTITASNRTKIGKFITNVCELVSLEKTQIKLSINSYNKYGYVDLCLEVPDNLPEFYYKEIEKMGYRSNY